MMKRVWAIILICRPLWAFSQQEPKLSLGVNFSPNVSYRSLVADTKLANYTAQSVISLRNENESPKLGYYLGFMAKYEMQSLFSLSTGIQYTDEGEKQVMMKVVTATPEPNLWDSSSFNHHYHYLAVPLQASYTVGKGKIRAFASLGCSLNIFLYESNVITAYKDGKVLNGHFVYTNHSNLPYRYRTLNLGVSVGAGIDIILPKIISSDWSRYIAAC